MITRFHTLSNMLWSPRTILTLILALSVLAPFVVSPYQYKALAAGTTYYVDCTGGNDGFSGTSPSQAWRSMAKANRAPLAPGDSLLFKRGCTWYSTLYASWNGTADQRILIGAYGTGEIPKIIIGSTDLADGYHNNVEITGSFQIIEYIETTIANPPVVPGCMNNPVGYFMGFNFRNPDNLANGGSYNILRYVKATKHTAGANLNSNTHHNRIMKSVFTDNNVMQTLTPTSVSSTDDLGAWGVAVKGRYHEVGYNYFSNNNALCTYDTPPQGNSVELYEAQHSVIHHNISINDRDFSELGGSSQMRSDNNAFVYNLVISSIKDSHFIIARGGGNVFGPTYRTKLYHNTVYYTGAESQGIICGAGCSSDILTAKNNIIWAEWKAAYADGAFNEGNNIYWNSSGDPFVQFQNFNMSSTSKIANPQFVDPAQKNFRIKNVSPAIDTGMRFSWSRDLDCTSVYQGGNYDIGAYEYPTGSTLSIASESFQSALPNQLYLAIMQTTSSGEEFPTIEEDSFFNPCS